MEALFRVERAWISFFKTAGRIVALYPISSLPPSDQFLNFTIDHDQIDQI